MATKIYETGEIFLIDGTRVYLTPLKIKYLREFLDAFDDVKISRNDDEAISRLTSCATIAMQQYYPAIKTIEDLEDNLNLPAIYRILDIAAGIKINEKKEESVKEQAVDSGSGWEDLDLAKLEAEAFLLGIWKDYEELESSLSMPELTQTLTSKRDLEYQEKKFLAAIQGIDLDKDTGKSDPWEEMKARVFGRGNAANANDIVALQGANASKAGFGIGMGLDYERIN
jgi:hypothetical protein